MTKKAPGELYSILAAKLRARYDFAERILGIPGSGPQIVETVSLQGRKAVETIAYMMLIATEHGFGRANMPKDIKSHWNAETIFHRLKRKGLDLIPSPQRVSKSTRADIQIECDGIAEYRLSYDDLIGIYQTFHKGLHEPNPYTQPDDSEFYTKLIPVLRRDIGRLKNLTWSHIIFIRGEAFLCMLCDSEGKVGVMAITKTSDLSG